MFWRKKSQKVVDGPRYSGLTVYRVESEGREVHILSFVPEDPAFSAGIPIEAQMGNVIGDYPNEVTRLAPDHFQPNPRFLEFFHQQVARMLQNDPGIQGEAQRLGEGNVYIIDPRSSRREDGSVPGEDILGAFAANGGSVVAGSYQPNPNYRIVSTIGLPGWPDFIWNGLIESLPVAG